jgi:2,3-bisphosphoglycerate-independent phosphoglycerate mutase
MKTISGITIMDYIELMTTLSQKTPSKIILLVLDGLGGLPLPETGKTELETAFTPTSMPWRKRG